MQKFGSSRPSSRRVVLFQVLALLSLFPLLCLADMLCYQQGVPVVLDEQAGHAVLHVGSETMPLGSLGDPVSLQFPSYDPVIHEYQLDGTDSTNNNSLDLNYLNSIASSPYYLFQSWMRNLDGTSRWSDLRVSSNGHLLVSRDWPANGDAVSLQGTTPLHLQVMLRRPETARSLHLLMADDSVIQITLDRNNRKIAVTRGDQNIASAFFPVDALPFAAMVTSTLLRTLAWAVVLLLVVLVCEGALVVIRHLWRALPDTAGQDEMAETIETSSSLTTPFAVFRKIWSHLTRALHPLALVALLVSLCFVAWIAACQYHGQPHIYDASAYLFAAKMYATGHLSVPIPSVVDHFPGPFMVQHGGQWFGQYPPGTSLTLVPGIWLGVPWLVVPVLGTFALLGIGLIAARLFDRRVATLAVVLGALSPFYSYIAASYLSHAVTLFYLTWGSWALLRFFQGGARWNLPLAALFFGMGYLTRDQPTLLFVAVVFPGILLLAFRWVRDSWQQWRKWGLFSLTIALVFFVLTLCFNARLTGNPWITPRTLFFAADHWGFGQDVGFYGQHTLAAGFMNLDQLLTILAIDLYGWPFYLTLAFLALPFLTWRATTADWFCLICIIVLVGAYVGYFYHGIYLGPRYFFETLPFLLILTARGFLTLAAIGCAARQGLSRHFRANESAMLHRTPLSIPVALLTILLMHNLLYFLPRQIVLHQDYTGLPNGYHIDVAAVYHPPMHNAIVVTSDYTIYQFVLFPLNDPFLHDDIIYAWARNTTDYSDLQAAFPGKTLYRLDIASDGEVRYTPILT